MPDSPPTILVIDNDEGVVAAITTRLESMGYHCISACTGAQGLAAFREQPVNLIITDLNMPSGDGITLARSLRETSDVPIVVMTGFREDYRRELRAIPNVAIMEKPFDTDRLLELVEADLVLTGLELPLR